MAKFENLGGYFASLDETKAATLQRVLGVIAEEFPDSIVKLAWNTPQIQIEGKYVFGMSAAKNHLSLAPWSETVMANFADRLAPYETTKGLFKIPVDWDVDAALIADLIHAKKAEIGLA